MLKISNRIDLSCCSVILITGQQQESRCYPVKGLAMQYDEKLGTMKLMMLSHQGRVSRDKHLDPYSGAWYPANFCTKLDNAHQCVLVRRDWNYSDYIFTWRLHLDTLSLWICSHIKCLHTGGHDQSLVINRNYVKFIVGGHRYIFSKTTNGEVKTESEWCSFFSWDLTLILKYSAC
jgi:hypothetical protein